MIDLRSDTVTTPTPEMLRAMTAAEVGDDVYGEDPSLNRLEEEVAALLGKEAAVFTPSGSMANQIAILLHTRPGDSVLCEEGSHTFAYEAGAGAALSGVQFDLIPFGDKLSDEAITDKYRADGLHESPSTLILVENTHNRGRGRALPRQETERIVNTAHGLGLKAHCDGARLWNAAVATGHSERQLSAGFDTVSVCFSKGLGAPVGSALAGSREDVGRARKIRKRLGGGMRQAGFLAAAALYGVRQHRGRLLEDHRRAVALAEGLKELVHDGRPLDVDIPDPPTNMVYWKVADGGDVVARLRDKGVLVNHVGGGWIRSVTHLQISDSDIHDAIRRIREVLLASGNRD
ncbi:MAG: beta-eliminating lyase-related protein [Deltaproteobacteria bacterium]|nr:beta-eliminating lyase-related protein [Deltaproteobacteria bacterium]